MFLFFVDLNYCFQGTQKIKIYYRYGNTIKILLNIAYYIILYNNPTDGK